MDVSKVINTFAFQYYTVWMKAPELLYMFYEKHCRMSYDGEQLVGRQAVLNRATERATVIAAVTVVSVQGVLSTTDLLVVFVNGFSTGGGNRPRYFAQTFELRRHLANKFSIVTSMFHTVASPDTRSVAVQATVYRDERIRRYRRAKCRIQPKKTGPAEVVG